jgi:hypothetical protein
LKFEDGEVRVTPKLIYWIEMPANIKEYDKMELLKRDILLVEFTGNFEKLPELIKLNSKYMAFIFNLEGIFSKNNISKENETVMAGNLLQFIISFAPGRCLVHTTNIEPEISQMFINEGIPYMERNLFDKRTAFSTIVNLIKPFFSEQQRINRSYVRVHLFPMRFKIEIENITRKSGVVLSYLRDLSLNGLQITLHEKNDLNLFGLKDIIRLKVYIKGKICKINMAYVTRVDEATQSVSISYNILNEKMIREDDSDMLISLVYNWLVGIVEKHGYMSIAKN